MKKEDRAEEEGQQKEGKREVTGLEERYGIFCRGREGTSEGKGWEVWWIKGGKREEEKKRK